MTAEPERQDMRGGALWLAARDLLARCKAAAARAAEAPVGGSGRWLAISAAPVVLVVAPLLALLAVAAEGSGGLWPHLATYVLPVALWQTALLLSGVGVIVVAIGTGAAWLVTAYDFPGRRLVEWALLLPLAVPTYIVAYAYLDLLHPIGPVQSALRALFGIADPRDLSFPDVRSLPGCIVLIGFVLYPYVYVTTRAMFLMQAASVLEAARTLGASPLAAFCRIALPLARPAIAVGTSLAMLEALNDIGAAEFLGVRTLTVSVYSTWINRSNLPGAAQIALMMLVLVLALITLERAGRRRRDVADADLRRMEPVRLAGPAAWAALAVATLPVGIGFAMPAAYLVVEALKRLHFAGFSLAMATAALNTVMVAAVATVVTLVFGLSIAATRRLVRGPVTSAFARLASLGYAVPGTILAIGLLSPLASLDNALDAAMRQSFGVSTGLVLSGSGAALVYAYVVRFLAIAVGGIESGFAKIPRSMDDAARTLGASRAGVLARVHLPVVKPAFAAAALLVFVDCMKELPATLLLRPAAFETLATRLYAEAARGTYEDGAMAALLIVLVGLLPVVMLARVSRASGEWVVRPSRLRRVP